MYARQQILAAIVSDGRRLLGDGAGTVDAAFQRKLSTLGAQWQSVVRRAAQRKAAIDGGVVRWREYRRRTDETDGRLAEMERGVAALEATGPASIERITAMLAAAKVRDGGGGRARWTGLNGAINKKSSGSLLHV